MSPVTRVVVLMFNKIYESYLHMKLLHIHKIYVNLHDISQKGLLTFDFSQQGKIVTPQKINRKFPPTQDFSAWNLSNEKFCGLKNPAAENFR